MKKYSSKQIQRSIDRWTRVLESMNSKLKNAYLQSIRPKVYSDDRVNGICLLDDNGNRIDYQFNFEYNRNCDKNGKIGIRGWSAYVDNTSISLNDFDSGYGPKDISLLQLSQFLEDHGYNLIDER